MNFLMILIGIIIGMIINKYIVRISNNVRNNKIIDQKNKQFESILSNILKGKSRFKTRLNNNVVIDMTLFDIGEVSLIYFMDKNDVALFRKDTCIATSDDVNQTIIQNIVTAINKIFYNEINNVIEIFGLIFSKIDFERTFNINIDELYQKYSNLLPPEESDIKKIIKNNNKKLDIDDILDKINKVGINNLSEEEKLFLDNYNKK